MRLAVHPGWKTLVLGSALLVAGLEGCGEKLPKTFPVSGKVLYNGNPAPWLRGGVVRFQSVSDPDTVVVGEIQEDGTFALGQTYKGKGLPGVVPGEYKASVQPDEDRMARLGRRPLDRKYQDFDKSGLRFTVPGSEDIVIDLKGPR